MNVALKQSVKIAVVGDIHDQWEPEDGIALKQLGVDLVLFVGDFGNEAVEVVEAIAALDLPKAVVFGNHDAWYTMTEWGQKNCPYDTSVENRVQRQMDLVAEAHVGYGQRDFPEFGLSVVGTRPFSWGGPKLRNRSFYQKQFGVESIQDSTDRIVEAVQQAAYDTIIFLGHNGPTGLGETPESPCGRDWNPIGGDYGDPDFAAAIAQTQALQKTIPLVTFGHMHHNLRHRKDRDRQCIHINEAGTVYLNAAKVRRIQQINQQKCRNFSIVSLENGIISEATLVWVGPDFDIVESELLYKANSESSVKPI
ncbi:MAG: TIGR04168 family protein [Microcoleaceae cyanobacterium]